MPAFVDITGQKYGRLTAIGLAVKGSRQHKSKWRFRCDCGNEIILTANAARSGNTKSCGCLRKEVASARSKAALKIAQHNQITHGMTGSRIYGIYKNMKQRCYNPHKPDFKYYGARGITICDEWLKNPKTFIAWAYSHGYSDSLTIERKDSNKGYCPENCEFITQSEQARRAVVVRERNRRNRNNAAS